MKRVFVFCILSFIGNIIVLSSPTQPQPLDDVPLEAAIRAYDVVKTYAENLNSWCKTKDASRYSYAIKELCSESFRVSDDIMSNYILKKRIQQLKHYDYNDYEQCIDDIICSGGSIELSNIAIDWSIQCPKNWVLIKAELNITGNFSYYAKELFCIDYNGKILSIKDYDTSSNLSIAFMLCKDKKYQEAFNMFEKIAQTSKDWTIANNAEAFAMSLLQLKHKKLGICDKIRDYKLIRYAIHKHIGGSTKVRIPNFNWWNYYKILGYYGEWECTTFFLRWSKFKKFPYHFSNGGYGVCYQFYMDVLPTLPVENEYFPIFEKGKYGYSNKKGEIIIPIQFLFATPFNDRTGIAVVKFQDKKWGYIDKKGQRWEKDVDKETEKIFDFCRSHDY
jgi:hypothetical protein